MTHLNERFLSGLDTAEVWLEAAEAVAARVFTALDDSIEQAREVFADAKANPDAPVEEEPSPYDSVRNLNEQPGTALVNNLIARLTNQILNGTPGGK